LRQDAGRSGGDVLSQRYTLTRTGNLLFARAAASGPAGTKVINLLVDTGSTFTILPVEVLESIGVSPVEAQVHERIATGSGFVIAPKVRLSGFSTLGRKFSRVLVIAHTLPFGGPIDGLLGMDILCRVKAVIAVARGTVEVD
jgi:predicted aspartyl protease